VIEIASNSALQSAHSIVVAAAELGGMESVLVYIAVPSCQDSSRGQVMSWGNLYEEEARLTCDRKGIHIDNGSNFNRNNTA
jgi:hypothetical protein